MQLWSLKHDDGMFVMHRKRKATIYDSIDDISQTIHQLIYLCHTVKVSFIYLFITVKFATNNQLLLLGKIRTNCFNNKQTKEGTQHIHEQSFNW
jgi:hypothetical protein